MNGALPQNQFQNLSHSLLSLVGGTILFKRLSPNCGLWIGNGVQNLAAGLALAPFAVGIEPVGDIVPSWRLFIALAYLVLQSTQSKTDQSTLHCSMRSLLNSPRAWSVSLGMGAEELEQQCVVGLDLCLRKVMAAMVELDETRMCNLLGNQLAQLPWNEEIICGTNQQRRVADTAQAFSGVISDQRVDACRRDFLRRVPGRAAPIKTHLLVQRSLAEHKQPAQSRVQTGPRCAEDEGRDTVGMIGCEHLRNGTAGRMSDQMHAVETQVIDEPQRVRGPLLSLVGWPPPPPPPPAMIESHDLECRGKGGDLCHPVGAVFAKAWHEHDGWTCAGNVIGQRSAIDRDHQHCHVARSSQGWRGGSYPAGREG